MNSFSHRGLTAIIASLAVIALVAAGCGGGNNNGGGSVTGSTSLTKAEFISKGDAICEKGEKKFPAEMEAFAQEHKVTKRISQALGEEATQTVLVPSLQAQADQLARLGAPSGEEDEVEAIVGGLQGVLAEAEDDPSVIESAGQLAEVANLAKSYGFEVCLKNF